MRDCAIEHSDDVIVTRYFLGTVLRRDQSAINQLKLLIAACQSIILDAQWDSKSTHSIVSSSILNSSSFVRLQKKIMLTKITEVDCLSFDHGRSLWFRLLRLQAV